MPLATLHFLREIKRVGDFRSDPRQKAFTWASHAVLNAWEVVEINIAHREEGTDAFYVGFDLHDPKPHLPRPTRVYSRQEPLLFPKKLPPARKTHCHG